MSGVDGRDDLANLAGLDAFAQSFAAGLFAAAPELRAHAHAQDGALEVGLAPGPARTDAGFWISTADQEVTVGFGMFHMHFDWPPRDDVRPSDPVAFVRSLMADETLVEDWTLDGRWAGSSILAANDEPDLKGMQPGHVVYVRSWSGARDRTIRGR